MPTPKQIKYIGAFYRLAVMVENYEQGVEAFRGAAKKIIDEAKKAEQAAGNNANVANLYREIQSIVPHVYTMIKNKDQGAAQSAIKYLNQLKGKYEQLVGSNASDAVYHKIGKMLEIAGQIDKIAPAAPDQDKELMSNILTYLSQQIGTALQSVSPWYQQLKNPANKQQIKTLAQQTLLGTLSQMLTQLQSQQTPQK